MQSSWWNKNLQEFWRKTQIFVYLGLGTKFVGFSWFCISPHAFIDLELLIHLLLMLDWESTIHDAPMPLSGVEPCLPLGWSIFFMGLTLRICANFCGSFSQYCNHKGCATPYLPYVLGCDLLSLQSGRLLLVQANFPMKLTTYNLNLTLLYWNHAGADIAKYSFYLHAKEGGSLLGIQ